MRRLLVRKSTELFRILSSLHIRKIISIHFIIILTCFGLTAAAADQTKDITGRVLNAEGGAAIS